MPMTPAASIASLIVTALEVPVLGQARATQQWTDIVTKIQTMVMAGTVTVTGVSACPAGAGTITGTGTLT